MVAAVTMFSKSNDDLQRAILSKALGGGTSFDDDRRDVDADPRDARIRELTEQLNTLTDDFRIYREVRERQLSELRAEVADLLSQHERAEVLATSVIERQRHRIDALRARVDENVGEHDTPRVDNRSPKSLHASTASTTTTSSLRGRSERSSSSETESGVVASASSSLSSFSPKRPPSSLPRPRESPGSSSDNHHNRDESEFGERSEDTFDWEGLKGRPNGPIAASSSSSSSSLSNNRDHQGAGVSAISLQLEDLMSSEGSLGAASSSLNESKRGGQHDHRNDRGQGHDEDPEMTSFRADLSRRRQKSARALMSLRWYDDHAILDRPPTLQRQKRRFRLSR